MTEFQHWLESIGLGAYVPVFLENEVDDFAVLSTLSESELAELGLPIGARKKLLMAIQSAQVSAAPQPVPSQPVETYAPAPSAQPLAPDEHYHQPEDPHLDVHAETPQEPAWIPAHNFVPISPLVPLEQIPAPAPVQYEEPHYHPAAYQQEVDYEEMLVVDPWEEQHYLVASEQEFPLVAPHEMLVANPGLQLGEPGYLPESVEKEKNTGSKLTAVAVTILVHVVLVLLLLLWVFAQPDDKPPEIVAIPAPVVEEQPLEKKTTVTKRMEQNPSAPSSTPTPIIAAVASSPVAVPTIEAPPQDPVELGIAMGSGTGFGFDTGVGTGGGGMFMGTRVDGNMAVIFDVTGSMYHSVPLVIKEIQKHFKNAQVVAVHGATFKDQGDPKLMPFKTNKKVYEFMGRNTKDKNKVKIREAMQRDLEKLRRCDSLTPEVYLQSLGKALEALLKQRSYPRTVFIFSDFQDGVDPKYMSEIESQAKRRKVKVVAHHPKKWQKDKSAYEKFTKSLGGEVKEGGLDK